jgi:hypothetical protein
VSCRTGALDSSLEHTVQVLAIEEDTADHAKAAAICLGALQPLHVAIHNVAPMKSTARLSDANRNV